MRKSKNARAQKLVRERGNRGAYHKYLTPHELRLLSTSGASLWPKVIEALRLGFALEIQRVLPFQSAIRMERQETVQEASLEEGTPGDLSLEAFSPRHLSSS